MKRLSVLLLLHRHFGTYLFKWRSIEHVCKVNTCNYAHPPPPPHPWRIASSMCAKAMGYSIEHVCKVNACNHAVFKNSEFPRVLNDAGSKNIKDSQGFPMVFSIIDFTDRRLVGNPSWNYLNSGDRAIAWTHFLLENTSSSASTSHHGTMSLNWQIPSNFISEGPQKKNSQLGYDRF